MQRLEPPHLGFLWQQAGQLASIKVLQQGTGKAWAQLFFQGVAWAAWPLPPPHSQTKALRGSYCPHVVCSGTTFENTRPDLNLEE